MLVLLGLDVGNYFAHYCLHRFDVLWQFHKTHHSSRELDWLANFPFAHWRTGSGTSIVPCVSVCPEMVLL